MKYRTLNEIQPSNINEIQQLETNCNRETKMNLQTETEGSKKLHGDKSIFYTKHRASAFIWSNFSEYKLIDNALETSSKALIAESEVLSFNSSTTLFIHLTTSC